MKIQQNFDLTECKIVPTNLLKGKTLDQFIKDRVNETSTIAPEDTKIFDFPERIEKTELILFKGTQLTYPVGDIYIGHKKIVRMFEEWKKSLHSFRVDVKYDAEEGLVKMNSVHFINTFGCIVRTYEWMIRKGFEFHSIERLRLIDNQISLNEENRMNIRLVAKNKEADKYVALHKFAGKKGYAILIRPLSSFIDKDDSTTQIKIVDSIVQIKNAIREALNNKIEDIDLADM